MSLRMLSLHRSISGPHLYPLWHKAKRKQTVCLAQHPGFLFAEVMEIRDSGLAHLKQLQGTGLSVFLGPCVSDHSTAQDVKDAGVLGAFRALLCASWNRNKIFFWSKTLHRGTCWIQRTCKNLIPPFIHFLCQSVYNFLPSPEPLERVLHEDKTYWTQHIKAMCHGDWMVSMWQTGNSV